MKVDRRIAAASLALQFLLELGVLAALCYWGFTTGDGSLAKIALGIGAQLLAAAAWATPTRWAG